MNAPTTNTVKSIIVFLLIAVSSALLFLPLAEGSEDVKGMFLLLTGVAVRDYFGGVQSDKRVEEVKQAYDPAPAQSYVRGDEE
jgi:hypothetical protein